MPETSVPKATRQRADARRNGQILRAVAREVFAESGYTISIAEIARRSNLGMGTVYRHFPNKTALMEEIASEVMHEMHAFVEEVLASDEDPWEGFRQVFLRMASVRSSEFFPSSYSRNKGHPGRELLEARSALLAALDTLIRRAQESGQMRGDINVNDVVLVLSAIPPRISPTSAAQPVQHAERHMRLLLDGLRSTGQETLPGPDPSREDVDRFFDVNHNL